MVKIEVVKEPQWTLDRADSGSLFWRRNVEDTKRVKFRYEVDVKEFDRTEYELQDHSWMELPGTQFLISMACIFCITATVLLPWYLMLRGKVA